MKTILLFLLSFSFLPACVTVVSVSTSQVPPAPARQQKVSASASNLVVLLIPFGNSFVERAREDLERQCPQGAIEGIQAKHQNTNYFLGLVFSQEVVMQGYCINARKKG